MIASTHGLPQRISPERRRPRASGSVALAVSSTDVTFIMGSCATEVGLDVAIDSPGRAGPSSAAFGRFISDGALQRGRRLGPFTLIARLGQGAQGDVWKAARDGIEGETFALKVLNPTLAKHARRLAQFRREAERGARLVGPSLLPVFESGEVEGYLYMAMPFVEGVSLFEVIRTRRAIMAGDEVEPRHPLTTLDADGYLAAMTRIMARAARALNAVHANRIVHRDIKPANILVDRNRPDTVYLCDLGLGRDLEVATTEQMRDGAGTPMYMAPERLLRAPADEIRSDVYSMGVTLFEALTLSRPFDDPEGVPLSALSAFLARARPRSPRMVAPRLPKPLEAIILKAMARNPADRFNSARELADSLDRWVESSKSEPAFDVSRDHVHQPHHSSRNRSAFRAFESQSATHIGSPRAR